VFANSGPIILSHFGGKAQVDEKMPDNPSVPAPTASESKEIIQIF